MAPAGENFRGINAVRLLTGNRDYTIEKIIRTGYDPHLSAFDVLLPALLKAYQSEKDNAAYADIRQPMQILSVWDGNCSAQSVATTVAIEWAQRILPAIMRGQGRGRQRRPGRIKQKPSRPPPPPMHY